MVFYYLWSSNFFYIIDEFEIVSGCYASDMKIKKKKIIWRIEENGGGEAGIRY